MKRSINEKYFQSVAFRNDIFRKFEKQFKFCFLNPINIIDGNYVEYQTNDYKEAFDLFFSSNESDIKFFIGYTGVGKTTFTKHYFSYKTLGVVKYKDNGIVVPNSWDGKKISDDKYTEQIDLQISNIIFNLVQNLYNSFEYIIENESDELFKFISDSRPDILSTLNLKDIELCSEMNCSHNQLKLQKCKDFFPIEFSCSLLKYTIEKNNNIRKIIFIVDDVETLSQKKICYIVSTYFKMFECLHNMKTRPVINLLINLRPHSFRYLRNDIKCEHMSAYGNYLNNDAYRLIKNKIPNIKDIFIRRFEYAIANTPKPGNQITWDMAKNIFYEIIYDFDNSIIDMIAELCHMNIRAITDCFQMILSNRVWCQEFDDNTDYPNVRKGDYHFDIVNVVRTLACGESPVYTGQRDMQFNPINLSNIQSRPSFDDSDVFIPNLLIDPTTKECDVLPAIIILYLDGFFSSNISTPPQTEFITKKDLCNNLYTAFNKRVKEEKISEVIDYLFKNRVIRKSILSKDNDNTLNTLDGMDYIYLTLKGSRLLKMFATDTVLLEIYREDIKREYDDDYFKSSFELVSENNRVLLFEDLIKLIEEVYQNEDIYHRYILESHNELLFYPLTFPITTRILSGINNSLIRSQNIEPLQRQILLRKLNDLNERKDERINELKLIKI